MSYHIDTGLIKQRFATSSECPLCEIRGIVENNFLHEYLNDAVMEDSSRAEVNEKGFCLRHFDMLCARQNKLSVALQIGTRYDYLKKLIYPTDNLKKAKKQAQAVLDSENTCVICDLINNSMEKYFKTIAQMYNNEPSFRETLKNSKGFCRHHYAELLLYADYAGKSTAEYLETLFTVQSKNEERVKADIDEFCRKHDYRNARIPMGEEATALPRMGVKIYGKYYK